MTLSGYFMSKSVFGQNRPVLSAAEVQVNNSTFWQYKLFLYIRKHFSDHCRQTGVGWLESTNLQFFRYYIFVSFGNKVDNVVHYDNSSCWISADINKDDL